MSDKKIVISLAALQKAQPQQAQPEPTSKITLPLFAPQQQAPAEQKPANQNKIVINFAAYAQNQEETEPLPDYADDEGAEDVEMEMSQPAGESYVDVSIEDDKPEKQEEFSLEVQQVPKVVPQASGSVKLNLNIDPILPSQQHQQHVIDEASRSPKSVKQQQSGQASPRIKITLGASKQAITIPVGQSAVNESNELSFHSQHPSVQQVPQKITIPLQQTLPIQTAPQQVEEPVKLRLNVQYQEPQPVLRAPSPQPQLFTQPVQEAIPDLSYQQLAPKPLKKYLYLTDLYKITHRQLSLRLLEVVNKHPSFKAQLIISLELKPQQELEEIFETLKNEQYARASLEFKLQAKHIQITDICELEGVERTKNHPFNNEDQDPQRQAQVQDMRFGPDIMQLSDIQHKQKHYQFQETFNGTCQLKKKFQALKLQKYTSEQLCMKLRPMIRLLIEYKCDQITQGGGFKLIPFLDESSHRQHYYYTAEMNQECWLPQIVGAQRVQSEWSLRIVVPNKYMVIASGHQTQRLTTEEDALHTYEVSQASQEKLGMVICPFPKITQVPNSRVVKGTFASFQSSYKQQCFLDSFVVEVQEYLSALLQVSEYPVKQVNFVFLPNLLAKKFPKQSFSFAEGLHLLDEQILFQPNQIDKRHHFYKQVAGAVTFDFFGSTVSELHDTDMWLLTAIRERIGDRMKRKKCGFLLYKYQTMRAIDKLYKQVKSGAETHPLQPHSDKDFEMSQILQEQLLSDVFYRKCGLLMHMMESSIGQKEVDEILRGLYQDSISKDHFLSHIEFRKKFKKVCGMYPNNYYKNWIWATSCPEFELSYEFNKRQNEIDLTLKQTSAVAYGESEHKSLADKIDKIFTGSANGLTKISEPFQSLQVDLKQASKRFFAGEVNIVIYQTEGNGGDIIPQQVKYTLKELKSEYSTKLNLQGKVKRTMNARKREDQFQTIEQKLQNDLGQFKMNEFELEDYPEGTKNIFENLDNSNPVLWIRVDPDFEYIRKVRINQDKRNNWLFQLLREQDIIGQIEAVRRLHVYNEHDVYEILKTVLKSENYFYKVRKEVLKALQKMEVFTFQQFLSHEQYLIKRFDSNRVLQGDISTVFYKENDFSNILEYYHERELLKAISKCKEQSLILTSEKEKEVRDLKEQRKNQVMIENGTTVQQSNPKSNDVSQEPQPKDQNKISLPIIDNKIMLRSKKTNKSKLYEESQYQTTTAAVAQMLLQVLAQNDNSSNDFDDSYYIRDLLASLGRVDNISYLPAITGEIHRQFKLDQISNSSTQYAVTLGAIKAYFNLQKQLFKFRTEKQPNLNFEHESNQQVESTLDEVLLKLKEMKNDIDKLFVDQTQPMEIRLFIFSCEVKNLLKFKSQSFAQALTQTLTIIDRLQERGQIQFAFYALRQTVTYLEQKSFNRLDLKDAHNPEVRDPLVQIIWKLFKLPHAYLSCEFTYWIKRLIKKVYNNNIPNVDFVQPFERDEEWFWTEAEHLQYQSQQEAQKHQQFLQQQQIQNTPIIQRQQQNVIQTPQTKISFNPVPQANLQLNMGAITIPMVQKPVQKKEGSFKIQIGLTQNHLEYEDLMSDDEPQPVQPSPKPEKLSDGDESEIDPFAQIVMDDPIMQKCWLVLGTLFYHYDSTDFLEPITPETVGQDMYDDYCRIISDPVDISMIKHRCEINYYLRQAHGDSYYAKEIFRLDVIRMFANCRKFNEKTSDIVKSSERMEDEFQRQWYLHGL